MKREADDYLKIALYRLSQVPEREWNPATLLLASIALTLQDMAKGRSGRTDEPTPTPPPACTRCHYPHRPQDQCVFIDAVPMPSYVREAINGN